MYNGQSMAFDPKGNKLCNLEDTETTQTVTLKYEELARYRKKFPVFLDADNYKLEL